MAKSSQKHPKRKREVKRCDEAAVELETFLNGSELDEIKKKLGALLTPDRADPAHAIMTSLPHAESLLLGLSRSLDSSLKHSIMLQAIPEGVSSIAQLSGSPSESGGKSCESPR